MNPTLDIPVSGKSSASLKTIVEICDGRFLSAEHLARLLNRNADGLRNRYLSPMVAEGLLALRYPESATGLIRHTPQQVVRIKQIKRYLKVIEENRRNVAETNHVMIEGQPLT